ncbi:Intraflagellar transport protein 20 [Perkinsus olseni]|uniref:Intraflagellar transport protein 20 n=1 Tax=Perkinsus olseni TaxID=32597 RepID=A0A7J6LWB1_PEROL|nr:Intraflagellar transport protein 20 [Perkinsus olseni]KAF4663588.1 Intraflagellar transport protein 20 [Perkinsus olseni]
MIDTDVTVSFDSANRLRVLPEDAYIHSTDLRDTSVEFSTKSSRFNDVVGTVVSHLAAQAEQIDEARLRVIGARTMTAMERDEGRERKIAHLQTVLAEKRRELARVEEHRRSMEALEMERKATLERLMNNE